MTRFCQAIALVACATHLAAAERGESVAVLYNRNLPESKALAEYYAQRRNVPTSQLYGADVLAGAEVMSRADFRDRLQEPLSRWFISNKLFTPNEKDRAGNKDGPHRLISEAAVRYLVVCYGIPLKVARDTTLDEPGTGDLEAALQGRNEAAVDAELALLPLAQQPFQLTGPIDNPLYLTTNAAVLNPTNGLLLVTRLDGPSIALARGLVDKAIAAENHGLWGRAYIDARGITNGGPYQLGDDWMRAAAEVTRRLGFDTVVDNKEATFGAAYPMSDIAFYAGWYAPHVSGPFSQARVEFMPGAFAYHLHSYSAASLHTATQYWAGPLLAKGATITFGTVDEPLLAGTPNVAAFLERLIYRRFTFAEAAYASQRFLSWQTTVVGDPLYRPFAHAPDVLHQKLESEKSPLAVWSHLRVIGLNEATGLPAAQTLGYIESVSKTRPSAVLAEKEGDVWRAQKRLSAAAEAYAKAVKLDPSPQQKIRLLLTIGDLQSLLGREEEAFDAYKKLAIDAPEYPDVATVYQRLADLGRKLGRKEEAEKFAAQAERAGKAR
jgi:uncharacterized protein (TIGR03790 family)